MIRRKSDHFRALEPLFSKLALNTRSRVSTRTGLEYESSHLPSKIQQNSPAGATSSASPTNSQGGGPTPTYSQVMRCADFTASSCKLRPADPPWILFQHPHTSHTHTYITPGLNIFNLDPGPLAVDPGPWPLDPGGKRHLAVGIRQ
jgi:hypothetical protein